MHTEIVHTVTVYIFITAKKIYNFSNPDTFPRSLMQGHNVPLEGSVCQTVLLYRSSTLQNCARRPFHDQTMVDL